eukprot:COSAG06_NODE_50075_length_321_cov_0.684685_1_plen_49_part_01
MLMEDLSAPQLSGGRACEQFDQLVGLQPDEVRNRHFCAILRHLIMLKLM